MNVIIEKLESYLYEFYKQLTPNAIKLYENDLKKDPETKFSVKYLEEAFYTRKDSVVSYKYFMERFRPFYQKSYCDLSDKELDSFIFKDLYKFLLKQKDSFGSIDDIFMKRLILENIITGPIDIDIDEDKSFSVTHYEWFQTYCLTVKDIVFSYYALKNLNKPYYSLYGDEFPKFYTGKSENFDKPMALKVLFTNDVKDLYQYFRYSEHTSGLRELLSIKDKSYEVLIRNTPSVENIKLILTTYYELNKNIESLERVAKVFEENAFSYVQLFKLKDYDHERIKNFNENVRIMAEELKSHIEDLIEDFVWPFSKEYSMFISSIPPYLLDFLRKKHKKLDNFIKIVNI